MAPRLGDLRDREDRRAAPDGRKHLPPQPRIGHEDIAQERQRQREVEEITGEPRREHRRNAVKKDRSGQRQNPPRGEQRRRDVDHPLQRGAAGHLSGGDDDVEASEEKRDSGQILVVGDRNAAGIGVHTGYPVQADEDRHTDHHAVRAPLDRHACRERSDSGTHQLHAVLHFQPARHDRGQGEPENDARRSAQPA